MARLIRWADIRQLRPIVSSVDVFLSGADLRGTDEKVGPRVSEDLPFLLIAALKVVQPFATSQELDDPARSPPVSHPSFRGIAWIAVLHCCVCTLLRPLDFFEARFQSLALLDQPVG
jgi:hypothetical protein